jgi:hypothetical protein
MGATFRSEIKEKLIMGEVLSGGCSFQLGDYLPYRMGRFSYLKK